MQKYLSGDQHVTLQHQKPKYYVRIMQRENPKRKPNGRQLASIEAPKASRGPPGPLHARSIAPRRECCLRACAEPNVLLQKGAHQQKNCHPDCSKVSFDYTYANFVCVGKPTQKDVKTQQAIQYVWFLSSCRCTCMLK